MARLFILLALLNPLIVLAGNSGSQIAWTSEAINLVKNGNAEHGKNLAETCKPCHGLRGEGTNVEVKDGETLPAIPALAGQNPYYMFKQLRDYYNDDRIHDAMSAIAKGINELDAADLAVWFSSLALPIQDADKQGFEKAKKMVSQGEGKRILPPVLPATALMDKGKKSIFPVWRGNALIILSAR